MAGREKIVLDRFRKVKDTNLTFLLTSRTPDILQAANRVRVKISFNIAIPVATTEVTAATTTM